MNRRRLLIGAATVGAAALRSGASSEGPVPASVLASDPRRPQFHFLPAANWMNDPNGPLFWNGQYHMFYQYNPNGAFWGDMHWGHAVGPDMVHWRHLPVALAPTPGGPDSDGCFTGSAVIDKGIPTLIYTGVRRVPPAEATTGGDGNYYRETQCLATCPYPGQDPELKQWTKLRSPLISMPPRGMPAAGFRDPAPWRDKNELWYLCLGSGERGKRGTVLLYRSRDLRQWKYLHPLVLESSHEFAAAGDMWECPDFFAIGQKHVLLYSAQGKVWWHTGTLDRAAMRFHPERNGILDYGSYYAAKTQLDQSGRRILWGWIPEARPLEEYRASGWAGLLSLPRILSLDSDGALVMTLAPQVASLRAASQPTSTPQITSGAGEFSGTASLAQGPFTVSLVARSHTLISLAWDPADPHHIRVDNQTLPLRPAIGPEMDFSFHVDGSVIELILDHRLAVTRRFYEPGTAAPVISANVSTGLVNLSAYEFTPISSNRLTT